MQPFKSTDSLEARMTSVALELLNGIEADRHAFYEGAFESYKLGDVLFDLQRSPMAANIPKSSFREIFFVIDQFFTRPGTFEFYLDVFRVIFGETVNVTFTVPAPGKLLINIQALTIQNYEANFREIQSGIYVNSEWVTTDGGDQILFQGTTGPKTQAELDRIMSELRTAGIWTVATLVV